ncbi:SRPBCC family protein [Altererythrobacter sp.]|uniref:SRPBCC family protein n=1 Tax=Altererythrobacter sp. TaxID=1872480 RepID=UPI001B2118BD|nr:SRPBCC family protein [Altererythrobacter sp.]MBO6609958.1 SRPBCC family protein [Altererythrobacter sp.]MBO6641722.1 SRPBCC family protein [Altererythrobacter sp.]MBO6707579.1 SRPBCC family protein [Altererythrobacter sp.]
MKFPTAITGALLIACSGAAQAEIVASSEDGFVTRDTAVVDATPMEVWLALISPGKWWNDAHTWSGDAANMSLKPQAGGCFCERIPEDLDADRVTLEGSVEHMRVIQAFPERALRMRGGLGPLQSEPVGGVLTIVISDAGEGTQIVWEYVVGGYMRYHVDVIAPAVDGVMTQQLDGLASLLGRLDTPAPLPEVAVPEVAEAPVEEADPEAVEEKPRSSVDEAFSDLSDN